MAKTKALAKTEKKILITGGTGFLGAHIVRQFLDAGEKNLKVMASLVPEWMKDAGIKAVEGSVTNRDDVAKACKNVSAIFHLAGKVSRDNDDAAAMKRALAVLLASCERNDRDRECPILEALEAPDERSSRSAP